MTWSFYVQWDWVLGSGGEGTVYLATLDDVSYALKISNATDWYEQRRALSNEVARHLRAEGDGILGLVAWNLDGPTPFLVYELATEGSLADAIARHHRERLVYHPVNALSIVRDVLIGLHTAHMRGVIHRDVKPGNVLLVGDRAKLADFGMGRTLSRPKHLQTEFFVGTRAYAAPEQRRRGSVDHRADLYAVGVVLYEMLMGVRPSMPYVAPSALYANVTPRLDALLGWLLRAHPATRPSSAAAVVNTIDIILAEYADLRSWHAINGWSSPY